MVNQQFGKLLVVRAETIQRAIAPAHPAISAVFPAVIGNFHHAADEYPPAEPGSRHTRSFFVKRLLSLSV